MDNARFRFGSAGFATAHDFAQTHMLDQNPDSLMIGFFGSKPIWHHGAGGLLLTAGARSGKLRDILAYNICAGIYNETLLILDMKGELAYVSQNQTQDNKFCIYWNPAGLHGLPQHRANPVDYIHINNPNLVSDVKVFCVNMIAPSGSPQGEYFERRAQEFLEAIILTLVKLNGYLTLPDLYQTINLIPGGGDEWLDFAYEMNQSGFAISVRVEEEIANSRDSQSNGFQGILGELFKAFSSLSDPTLMESVSPPFDFSCKQLCEGAQKYHFYMMPPAEFIDAWSPVIKAHLVAAMVYKSRAPQASRQTWILDECAQLNKFPLVTKLYTYGAGIGIRPWAVFQSNDQMKALGQNAENIILSSAQTQIYFGVRDIGTALSISRMIGSQTLEYFSDAQRIKLETAKRQAVQSFINGGDPMSAAIQYRQHKEQAAIPEKQQRLLRTPEEILNTPDDKAYIFTDALQKPIYANRKPYYEQRFMAGRYHPNPYHPPIDRVRVKTVIGHSWNDVIREPVPSRYSHYPQYKDGYWSYIKDC